MPCIAGVPLGDVPIGYHRDSIQALGTSGPGHSSGKLTVPGMDFYASNTAAPPVQATPAALRGARRSPRPVSALL